MCDESIKLSATPDYILAPSLNYIGVRPRIKFDGQCLKQDKAAFHHKPIVSINIVYEINLLPFRRDDDFTLRNALFGAVKLVKNANTDKHEYSGYGKRCANHGTFPILIGSGFGKITIVSGADMSSSGNFDNQNPWNRSNIGLYNANCGKRALD